MKPKKITAWLLIILGIALIFWTLYSSYSIFTGKSSVPAVFENQTEEKEGEPAEAREMVREEIRDMIPAEAVYQLLNLISWSILALILIFGGGRISIIGINLLRRS